MTTTQPIKSAFLVFEPVAPASVSNGSLFLDSTNSNKLSHKDLGGVVHEIGAGGGGTGYFIDVLTNLAAALVTIGDPYDTSTNKLGSFRNGVRLLKLAGAGGDRFTETSGTQITLGSIPELSDVLLFWNVASLSNFSTITGVSGTTLTVPTYVMGNKSLMIWRNGVLMHTPAVGDTIDRYVEATTTTLTLSVAATAGETFIVSIIDVPTARQDVTGLTGTSLTVPSYIMGNEKLLIFKNGAILQNDPSVGSAGSRYQEASSTLITLALAANTEDVFTYLVQA